MGFGLWCCSGGMGPWLWLGIDLAWGRGYGDNAGGGVELDQLPMGFDRGSEWIFI